MTPLGELLQQYRFRANMTLASLDSKVGVSKGSLSRIETGETKKPDFKIVEAVAAVLNIPYAEYVSAYIEIEKKPDILLGILETAVSSPQHAPIAPKIATKFLETEKEDSVELVAKLYSTTNLIEDTSIRISLYKSIVDYSRSHGIMPYIARGLFQTYMIERNDFSKLEVSYQSGKSILAYVGFLSTDEQLKLYYSLANHAYGLMIYNESIEFSRIVIEIDIAKSQLSAHATFNICNCYYYLNDFETSKTYLVLYQNYSYSFVEDNVAFMTGCINGRMGEIDLGINQLEQYVKNTSEFNLVYAVTMLMDLYVCKADFDSARKLLQYVAEMKKSMNNKYTAPDKKARLAYFYQLAGHALLPLDVEQAFDYYLDSAIEYMKIGLYDAAKKVLIPV
ncbi:helix-turn-helix domain-containing protein [Paenibacillus sp. 481]|nr:helix-turn-helix domain-containing protein [Paenibacillus sp. 481]